MSRVRVLIAGAALLVALTGYRLPPEKPPVLGEVPEAERVVANCSGCHSLDYITHQPPAMGPAFWTAEVTKMRTVYGAPVDEAEGARIAAFLGGLALPGK